MVNKAWLKAAGIRAIKTVAQTAVATIGTAAVINQVNWLMVVSASALGRCFVNVDIGCRYSRS